MSPLRWLEHKLPPPVMALLLGAAMGGLGHAGSAPLPALQGAWTPWLAGGLVGVGLGFDLTGLWAFYRARTTFNPLQPGKATQIVTTGVYRYTRNPMYVGLLCQLCAWAVWLSQPLAWVGPPLFVALINRLQIAPEERILAQKFGAEYRDYQARVRRWL